MTDSEILETEKKIEVLQKKIRKAKAEKQAKIDRDFAKAFYRATGIKNITNLAALEEYFRRYADAIKNTQKS